MRPARREVRLPDGRGGTVTGVLLTPAEPASLGVVLGHGAGGNLRTPLLSSVAAAVAESGFFCLRYNFPYAEAGRRRPDFPRVLEATVRSAGDWLRAEAGVDAIVLGGKSLGGRMSSHVAATEDFACKGLVFLGYPLHPPGRPDVMRDAHLPALECPMLFVQGTRDPFARLDLLEATLEQLRAAKRAVALHVVEDGDHSFRVPAGRRRPYDGVVRDIGDVVVRWLDSLPR